MLIYHDFIMLHFIISCRNKNIRGGTNTLPWDNDADAKNIIVNTCTVCKLENAKFQWKI